MSDETKPSNPIARDPQREYQRRANAPTQTANPNLVKGQSDEQRRKTSNPIQAYQELASAPTQQSPAFVDEPVASNPGDRKAWLIIGVVVVVVAAALGALLANAIL